ncbi:MULTISPECIES: NAD(P)/FAD-dependent oxidoreductase [Sphingobacterium]|uniref:NAD(P)/FAD-dependent oxidoreductase n=1 Tax=Sphingobacterium TaxID=28453 RepID=UPI0013D8E743|nr:MULTISPECIES: NAD(P)/FAD-dependent oxidoreductase [unclassified Sphingobacterium]
MQNLNITVNPMFYDLIIVGGGPTGASLAARIAPSGMKILLLEKDSLPNRTVISCSLLLSHGMQLLDEIGIAEELYASGNSRLRGAVLEVDGYFRTVIAMPEDRGRNYLYGIDRQKLDDSIWNNTMRFPNIKAVDGFVVSDIQQNDEGVIVQGVKKGEGEMRYQAKAIVGADGRHSVVARKCGAVTTEEVSRYNTAVFYAYWEHVVPYRIKGDEWVQIHTNGKGRSVVLMPSTDGKTGVLLQCRQADFDGEGKLEEWYMNFLHELPLVSKRFNTAKRVTPIKGIKNVNNLFRQAFGNSWVLAGDAYHQKDSYDAQGIYDGLLGAKVLSKHLIAWFVEGHSWEKVMQDYECEIAAHMKPMFANTMERLKREMFTDVSPIIANTVMRWLLTNKGYLEKFSKTMIRKMRSSKGDTAGGVFKALFVGFFRDMRAIALRVPKDGKE